MTLASTKQINDVYSFSQKVSSYIIEHIGINGNIKTKCKFEPWSIDGLTLELDINKSEFKYTQVNPNRPTLLHDISPKHLGFTLTYIIECAIMFDLEVFVYEDEFFVFIPFEK